MHKTRTLKGNKQNLAFRRLLRREQTTPEQYLWTQLRSNRFLGLKFKRQHGIGPYIADFYCAEKKIVIELDGESHTGEKAVAHDRKRDQFMRELGLRVIRWPNEHVFSKMDTLLEALRVELRGGVERKW